MKPKRILTALAALLIITTMGITATKRNSSTLMECDPLICDISF